mgnify:CR=1 FL=1
MIYLDHNATTPVLPEVLQAMNPVSAASRQTIRFSLGAGIQEADVAATLQAVQQTVNALRG